MAETFDVVCPCCDAVLQVDPETRTVLLHRETPKKPMIDDLAAAARELQGDAERRSQIFDKSFDTHLSSARAREKKFDELLKLAKEDTSEKPPKRAFDLD